MEHVLFDPKICPVTKTTDLIRGKWKPIILYLIENRVNRFGMMRRKMPNVSKKVLSQQLRELENTGLITRQVKIAQHPQEVNYYLTDKGYALRVLITQIFEWGTAHFSDNNPNTI